MTDNTNYRELTSELTFFCLLPHEAEYLVGQIRDIMDKGSWRYEYNRTGLEQEALEEAARYFAVVREGHDAARSAMLERDEHIRTHEIPPLTFGVEFLQANTPDRQLLLYLNTGDTYSETLAWDDEECSFLVTSWGGWYENDQFMQEEHEEELRTLRETSLPNNLEWKDELPEDYIKQLWETLWERQDILVEDGQGYVDRDVFGQAAKDLGFVIDLDEEE